ncbi:MAG: hypothetical protein FWF51_06495 [Chitinivibrionia bacterium]|nr:hypothetical protein [Chitinivibrionia bacterium]
MNEIILTGKVLRKKITSALKGGNLCEFTLEFTSTNATGITRKHYIDVIRRVVPSHKRFYDNDEVEVIGKLQDRKDDDGHKVFYVYARDIEILTSYAEQSKKLFESYAGRLAGETSETENKSASQKSEFDEMEIARKKFREKIKEWENETE